MYIARVCVYMCHWWWHWISLLYLILSEHCCIDSLYVFSAHELPEWFDTAFQFVTFLQLYSVCMSALCRLMSNIFSLGLTYYLGTMPQDRKRLSLLSTDEVLSQVKRSRSSSSQVSTRYASCLSSTQQSHFFCNLFTCAENL